MSSAFKFHFFTKGLIALLLLLASGNDFVFAQKRIASKPQQQSDTGKLLIHILNNDYGEFIQGDGRAVQKLMNNVKIRYGSDTLYCDSAFFYTRENNVEAFGDVAIYEADGTKAFAEYMRYTSANQRVYMRSQNGDVQLEDGKGNSLWSQEIVYQLTPKIGSFTKGGTLQSGNTIVTSKTGVYNLKTKNAHFKKEVVITDPQYYIQSSNLGYNTQSKVVTFFDTSMVRNDSSVLKTSSGFYNTIDSTAHFTKRSAIWNGNQFIESDTLDYNHKENGLAVARGNVIALDTAQNTASYSQVATYNEHNKQLFIYGKPLLRSVHGKDSLYIKADTFFSEPVKDTARKLSSAQRATEQLQKTAAEIQQQIIPKDSVAKTHHAKAPGIGNGVHSGEQLDSTVKKDDQYAVDTASSATQKTTDVVRQIGQTAGLHTNHQRPFDSLQLRRSIHTRRDTAASRYFIGYHHVKIFSDSIQGVCDSIRYNQKDSLLRMYQKPYLWPNKSQVTGKEIYLKLDSSSIRQLIVPEEGILIQRSGPEKAGMFNQIQGNTINGYFKNNRLERLVAEPDAFSIYYVTNDSNEYVGCSEGSSRQIEILFDTSGKVNRIYYRQDVNQKMTPMKDVQPLSLHLSRFIWQEKLRPKNLKTFLEGVSQPMEPVWK